jgi:hypothetical protein
MKPHPTGVGDEFAFEPIAVGITTADYTEPARKMKRTTRQPPVKDRSWSPAQT